MRIIVVMLALAIAALANAAQGAGTGMPMMKGLKDPTVLANLVDRALKLDPKGHTLLDSAQCKKDGSCATAHDYFHGIQIEHPSTKLGDIAELPRYLRSLVKQPAPAGEWYMSRLLVKGEKRTYDHLGWHRAFFKGEDVWDDPNTGEHILAGFCENVVGKLKSPVAEKETPPKIRDVTPVTPPISATPGPIRSCPDWWSLEIANWGNKAFYLPGVEQTHAKEKFGVKFVGVKHVSRDHGPQLRDAYAKGLIVHSAVPRKFRVSLIMTSEARNGDTTITGEKFYRDIVVTGSREVEFSLADINKWDAIRVIALEGEETLSPPRFAASGFHEMRFFNKEPGTVHGEWDNPQQRECFKTEHWIEQPQQPQK